MVEFFIIKCGHKKGNTFYILLAYVSFKYE